MLSKKIKSKHMILDLVYYMAIKFGGILKFRYSYSDHRYVIVPPKLGPLMDKAVIFQKIIGIVTKKAATGMKDRELEDFN